MAFTTLLTHSSIPSKPLSSLSLNPNPRPSPSSRPRPTTHFLKPLSFPKTLLVHFVERLPRTINATTTSSSFLLSLPTPARTRPATAKPTTHFLKPPSLTSSIPGTSLTHFVKHVPRTIKATPNFFSNLSHDLSLLTPFTIIKYLTAFSFSIFALKMLTTFLFSLTSLLLNPFFWTYFSMSWVFWPWYLTLLLTFYGIYSLHQYVTGHSSLHHQLAIVVSFITWLTVVPAAHFNGFLEGWPVAFFFIYHYFFFFESSVRSRLYGDLKPRPHDPKWDLRVPVPATILFAVSVVVGHWLAALEGPELHLVRGGWRNVMLWVLVMGVLFVRYHSVLYLAKYSESVAEPKEVVRFGPYRWVRHPIYASIMMLFASYCMAMRAFLSLLFLMVTCVVYYGRKAEMEESLMVEEFGERYEDYARKVRYRLIPFLY